MGGGTGIGPQGLGVHFLTPLHAYPGYHELCALLAPFYRERAFTQIMMDARGEHTEDGLAALAYFGRDSDECGLEHDIYDAAFRGKPLPAETIDALADLRSLRWANETVSRLLHVLLVYTELSGGTLRLSDLNEAMLPKLTVERLVAFAGSYKMQTGICGPEGTSVDVIDVTMYDGETRKALTWLRAHHARPGCLPTQLVRALSAHKPSITLVFADLYPTPGL